MSYEKTVEDRLAACASQLYFLRDCCAQCNKGQLIFELTPEGSRGLCWTLDFLAQEIENIANELNSDNDSNDNKGSVYSMPAKRV